MKEAEFPVKKESLILIQTFLKKWIEERNINRKLTSKIAICTDEIISNIVYYSGADFIRLKCCFQNNIVSISFIDNGKYFNPLTDSIEPDINAPIEKRQTGGLGILMIKKLMDSLDYSRINDCNYLTISISNK